MRILLVNQFFYPDAAATAQFLTDLASSLARDGHHVTVLCGSSDYAGDDAFCQTASPPGDAPTPGIEVLRLPNRAFNHCAYTRILSYASFLARVLWKSARVASPDLVITLTTPPLVSLVGSIARRIHHARHFIWEMDLYPDVASDLRFLRTRSPLTASIAWLADRQRRRADGVIALGDCMRDRLLLHRIPSSKIHVCENWADGALIHPLPFRGDGALHVLYSGNLGLAHDIDTVRDAAFHLDDNPRIRFFFSGGGSGKQKMIAFSAANGLRNVSFLPYHPRERLTQAFAAADVGLVTQNPACVGSVVPSKVYGLMAAGRAILYIGPNHATPARIIQRFDCGWRVNPGDSPALIRTIERLAADPLLYQKAGRRAREAFDAHYDLPIGLARIKKAMALAPAEVAACAAYA